MAKVERMPVMRETKPAAPPAAMQAWRPFEGLRREVDRLFEDFTMSPLMMPFRRPAFDLEPLWRPESWIAAPAMDLVEHEKAFMLTAELPGLDEKDVEVKIANGVLTIKGEKAEDKEEKTRDFHMRERRFGAFERALRIPDMVEMEKIEAAFKKGVLTVKMPKTAEAQKPGKKIAVKGE
jgi:HSP20 family protein